MADSPSKHPKTRTLEGAKERAMAMGEESSSSYSSNNASAIDSSNIGFQVRLSVLSLRFPFCPFRAHIISFFFF